MKLKYFIATSILTIFPFFAQAYTVRSFADLIYGTIEYILYPLAGLIISAAVIWIIYFGVRLIASGDGKDVKKFREKMIYGVVGLAVIVSMWGLVSVFQTTFGINTISTSVQTQSYQFINSDISGNSNNTGGMFDGAKTFWKEYIALPFNNIFITGRNDKRSQ